MQSLFSLQDVQNSSELENPFKFGLNLLKSRLQAEATHNNRLHQQASSSYEWKSISSSKEGLPDLKLEVKANKNAVVNSKLIPINVGEAVASKVARKIIIGE